MATPTYVPLGTITLASTDSEIVFSSIPATYRDLIVVVGGNVGTQALSQLRFNTDTGSNYSYVRAVGFLSTTVSDSGTSTSTDRTAVIGTAQSTVIFQVMDYSATDKHKTVLARSGAGVNEVWMAAARWANTAAINTVSVGLNTSTYQIGTVISLYGIH